MKMEWLHLQFEKRIPSDKDEIIFQFLVFDYNSKSYGDVIVNLSSRKFYMPEKAKRSELIQRVYSDKKLEDRYWEFISKNGRKKVNEFLESECMPGLINDLFEECEKIKEVIL